MTYLKLHLTHLREGSWNFLATNLKLLVKHQLNITHKNSKSQARLVIITKIKRTIDPMRKYMGSLRILNHQYLMGKLRKEKRKNPGC